MKRRFAAVAVFAVLTGCSSVSAKRDAEKQWGDTYPFQRDPQPGKISDLTVGQSGCSLYWYLSAENHIWIAEEHEISQPSNFGGCRDSYGLITRHVDGLHVHLFDPLSRGTDIYPDEHYRNNRYTRAVVVTH